MLAAFSWIGFALVMVLFLVGTLVAYGVVMLLAKLLRKIFPEIPEEQAPYVVIFFPFVLFAAIFGLIFLFANEQLGPWKKGFTGGPRGKKKDLSQDWEASSRGRKRNR